MSDGAIAVPMINLEAQDEVQSPLLPGPPDPNVNYATDEKVLEYIRDNIFETLNYARLHRQAYEEEMRETRRMALLEHDTNQSYLGRSKAYVPAYLRAEDTQVSQFIRGLFPSDDFMDVQEQGGTDPESARPVKDYLTYEAEKCSRLRMMLKPFARNYFRYGWAVGKVWYHKVLEGKKPRRGGLMKGSLPDLIPSFEEDASISGTRFSTRNNFNFYVWPPTVDSLEEATLVFEDIDVPKWYIEEMIAKKKWVNGDAALNATPDPTHLFNVQQQSIEMVGNSAGLPTAVPVLGDASNWRMLTEAWALLPLPRKAYVAGEEPGTLVMCKITCTRDGAIQHVQRNPFWHGKLPYLVARMRPEPGQFYCKGMGYVARYLQYLVNDFANQLNDNGSYSLNPFAKVNPNMLAAPLSPMRPGGIFYVTDPKAIEFDRPPVEQLQYGMQLMQLWQSMLMDHTGAPPILQGTNAGKGARTATSSQILEKNAMNPIQDIVEDLELDVMIPWMQMAFSLGQQYRDQEVWVQIAGTPVKIAPKDLVKDCTFRWLASSQSANQQQRAQQAMQLLSQVAPILPLLQQQGKTIDPTPLLKRVYSDGFGFRGFDQFVIPMGMPPGAMGQPPGGVPGQPPTPELEPGPNQAPGGDPMAQSGGAFGQQEDNSDALAAMMGGTNAGGG